MRDLAIALLDDNEGINIKAWDLLRALLLQESTLNNDIIQAVDILDDRVYLPDRWKPA